MKLQLAKGVKDVNPKEKIQKQKIVETLRKVFEIYGYNPLETPMLERREVLSSKYAGGEEILKEMFTLTDQGKRDLGLRYDLTVPLSRYMGMNPQLKIPFRRYQIGKVFRDGPIKLGRYREFWQCDVDIIGCKKMSADAEIIAIASTILKKLKLKAEIKINNRKLLNGILDFAEIPKEKDETVILSIDKLKKFGIKAVETELKNKGISPTQISKIKNILNIKGNNKEKISKLKKLITSDSGKQGLEELESLFKDLNSYKAKVTFDISLARGLAYYTGTVFEIFLINSEIKSAIAAGGRYDNMISQLLDTKKEFPAVGISFGLDVLLDVIKTKNQSSVAQIYIIPIQTKKESLKIAQKLRENNIKIAFDIMKRGISKNLDYANNLSIHYVLFIGPDELKKDKLKLKNMETGKEEYLNINNLIKKFL